MNSLMNCLCERGSCGAPWHCWCHTLNAYSPNGFHGFFCYRGTVAPKIQRI